MNITCNILLIFIIVRYIIMLNNFTSLLSDQYGINYNFCRIIILSATFITFITRLSDGFLDLAKAIFFHEDLDCTLGFWVVVIIMWYGFRISNSINTLIILGIIYLLAADSGDPNDPETEPNE